MENVRDLGGGEFLLTSLACPSCGSFIEVKINERQLEMLSAGDNIQKILPKLSPDQRERFISGLCPEEKLPEDW